MTQLQTDTRQAEGRRARLRARVVLAVAAAGVYLPSCLNRIVGNPRDTAATPTLPEALVDVSARAGRPLRIPDDVAGHCCGVPWSSKGYRAGHEHMAAHTADALRRWSDDGWAYTEAKTGVILDVLEQAQDWAPATNWAATVTG